MIDFIIVGAVCIVLFFAIRKIVKNQKKGSSCCGCSGCEKAESCGASGK